MDKTFAQLEKELAESKNREKNLKIRISTWRTRALQSEAMLKSLIGQYERVIREWQKMYDDLLNNGWYLLKVKLVLAYKSFRERRRNNNG